MVKLREVTTTGKLLLLIGVFVVGLASFVAVVFAWVKPRLEDSAYRDAVTMKDVIAEVLPPPMLVIEGYLLLQEMGASDDQARISALASRWQEVQHKFQERELFWKRTLPDGDVKRLLCGEVTASGYALFTLAEHEFLPAVRAGDRQRAHSLLSGPLREAYQHHRATVDDAVRTARAGYDVQVQQASEAMGHVRLWLAMLGALLVIVGGLGGWMVASNIVSERDKTLLELRESEDRFKNLAAAAFEGVGISENGRIIDANDQMLAMLGYERDEFLRMRIVDIVAPESRETVEAAIREGREAIYEHRLLRRDGTSFIAEARGKMLNQHGRALRMTALRDITERRRAEEALRGSENLLRQFIKHAPAAIAMLDKDLRYLQTSDRWLADYELRAEDIIGKSHYEVFPEIRERWKKIHQRVLAGSVERCDEDRFPRADGSMEWLQWECRPWYEFGGKVGGLLFFTQTITARKLMEASLEEERLRFRGLFDGAYELMGTVSNEGILLAANRTALDFGDVSESDVVGKPFWEGPWWQHAPELQDQLRTAIAQAAKGELVRLDVTHVDKVGATRQIDFSLKPLVLQAGAQSVLLAEGRDVTDLRRAEQERANLREQLHQAQRLESIGRLAGGIAHDFNNLLTVILGQLELAARGQRRGLDTSHSIQQAQEACESAASLTRQLLMFARKQVSQPEVLQVNDVVEQTQRMVQRVIGEDIVLSIDLAPTLDAVRIDRGQLEQLILNLVVNARDAMPDGGTVSIRTENATHSNGSTGPDGEPKRYVKVEVSDTGVGMTEQVKKQIFEPFFTTKGPGRGTGIGLATVQGVVEQVDGFIDVETELGKGSSFSVYLPASATAAEAKPAVSQELPNGSERVVVIEDQAGVRSLAEQQLSMLGYHVVSYSSAEEALRELPPALPDVDLVITDVVLEGLNGPALVERLRGNRPDLRVLYMSGYTEDAVLNRGLDTAAHLMHKPFSMFDLARAVRLVIDAPA